MSLFDIKRSFGGYAGETISGSFATAVAVPRGIALARTSFGTFVLDNGIDAVGIHAGFLTRGVKLGGPTYQDFAEQQDGDGGWPLTVATAPDLPYTAGLEVSVEPAEEIEAESATYLQLGNELVSVTVTNAGTGYTSAPAVTFTGGGGTGAAATAVLSTTTVGSLVITNPGSGYTSAPTVVFTGGGGSAAAGTAVIGGIVTGSLARGTLFSFSQGKLVVKQANQRAYFELLDTLTPEVAANTFRLLLVAIHGEGQTALA